MEILAHFIVTLINNTIGKLILFKVCRKGEAVIRTYLGKPINWDTKPSVYFHVPFFQELILVDMRRQFNTLYAHSYHTDKTQKSLIPYNIAIDMQIEYQIKHPYIIFDIEDEQNGEIEKKFKYEKTKVNSLIENKIHSELSKFLAENTNNNSYQDLVKFTETICSKYNIADEIKNGSQYIEDKAFSINSIVITSFDKNISFRSTV